MTFGLVDHIIIFVLIFSVLSLLWIRFTCYKYCQWTYFSEINKTRTSCGAYFNPSYDDKYKDNILYFYKGDKKHCATCLKIIKNVEC